MNKSCFAQINYTYLAAWPIIYQLLRAGTIHGAETHKNKQMIFTFSHTREVEKNRRSPTCKQRTLGEL